MGERLAGIDLASITHWVIENVIEPVHPGLMARSSVAPPVNDPDTASPARAHATALAVLLGGTFMAALDAAIANVAAPQIQADLGISGTALVLALSGYTLAYAMLLITGARLGDDYGHRRLFLTGLVAFTAASLACGIAPSGLALIIARIAQGAACALMTPQVATIIQLQYEGAARARALGLFATVIATGVVAGQVLGGLLVSVDILGLSWRSVFLINVPLGVALVAAGRRSVASTRSPERGQLDLVGVALCSGAVLLILLPLLVGAENGWSAELVVAIAAGVGLALAAALYFRALARRGGNPLVDPRIAMDGDFTLALGSLVASTIAWGGFLFAYTLYLQQGLGYSALESGLLFIPYGAAFALTSLGYRRLRSELQTHVPYIGLVVTALAYGALGLVDQNAWHVLASSALLSIAGGGYGLGFSPVITAALARVPARRARDASGILTTAIQLSYAVGITVLGSIFLSRAELSSAHASGRAFMVIAFLLCGLSLVAAAQVLLVLRRSRASDECSLQVVGTAQPASTAGQPGGR
jgi:EmrB/QacA subfamily drug resistance transporter